MSYDFDVFISYRRRGDVKEWVHKHFKRRLEQKLLNHLPNDPRIFLDVETISDGSRWPDEIRRGLQRSKIMVGVWSPDYFRSDWCMTEWQTMEHRSHITGHFTDARPHGLVYPIRFSDGEYFHPNAQATQCKMDFGSHNFPHDVWMNSTSYLEFDRMIDDVARDLAKWLESVPPWHSEWPVMSLPPLGAAHARRPDL